MRTSLLIAALVTSSLWSQVANAQDVLSEYSRANRQRPESNQEVAIEIRIGRYVPSVDSEFEDRPGPGPYEYMFGNDNRYSVGFEIDYQALRIPNFGSLGPGVSGGYTKSSATAFNTDTGDTERGSEKTALIIWPTYVVGVLRVDVLARQTPVPFVPYAKLGLGMAFWSVSGSGHSATYEGQKGSGLSYGPQFALGAMFLLDSIDQGSANEIDANIGVNNSYIFAEWYVSNLNGFGSGDQMNVGTNTWVLGLALEI